MALKYSCTNLKATYPAAYARIMSVAINDVVTDGVKSYDAFVSVTTFADSMKDAPLFGHIHKFTFDSDADLTYAKYYGALAALPEYAGNEPA